MPNFNAQPISQLPLITDLNLSDVIPIVDVTDNTQSPSGTTKKCLMSSLKNFIAPNIDGTTNEIIAALSDNTYTLALSSTLVLPGTLQVNNPVTIASTLTGAYHPLRYADMSVGEGTGMLLSDAYKFVISTNTAAGNYIVLFSGDGGVPLGFSTKVVMGNTGSINFIAEGSDNILNAGDITSLTTQYSTGLLTLISQGNWLLEIIS